MIPELYLNTQVLVQGKVVSSKEHFYTNEDLGKQKV